MEGSQSQWSILGDPMEAWKERGRELNELYDALAAVVDETVPGIDPVADLKALGAQRDRLRAENEQLREALEPFAYKDGCDCGIPSCARGEKKCRWCKAAALMNVALGGSQAKGSK